MGAGANPVNGIRNSALGFASLYSNTTGYYNTAVGYGSGYTNTTGSNNSFLGYNADVGLNNLDNATAIGANSIVKNKNQMILGDNKVVNVAIGYSGASLPVGKFSVLQKTGVSVSVNTESGDFHNADISTASATLEKKGIYALSDGSATNSSYIYLANIGGDFEANNSSDLNFAIRGVSSRGANQSGKWGDGAYLESNASIANIGVEAYGYNGDFAVGAICDGDGGAIDNYGVYGYTNGGGSGVNYGVYGYSPQTGNCTTGSCTDAAGYFNGDLYYAGGLWNSSDINLKDNIQPLQNAMQIIGQLHPKTFTFKTSQFPSMSLPTGQQQGLIAQDLETVLPGSVKEFIQPSPRDNYGHVDSTIAPVHFKAVNYLSTLPYVIGGLQEHEQKIDTVQATIDSLKADNALLHELINDMQTQLSNCCNAGNRHSNPNSEEGSNSSSIDVELKNAKSIILNQNAPNPFAEQTTISYFLTDDVKKAQMFFYDNKGTILKTVDLNEKGAGQINVFAADLSSGNYTYTLVADGKVVDTKKMVKTN